MDLWEQIAETSDTIINFHTKYKDKYKGKDKDKDKVG